MSVFSTPFLTGVTVTNNTNTYLSLTPDVAVGKNSTSGVISGVALARLRAAYNTIGSGVRQKADAGDITFAAVVNQNTAVGADIASNPSSKIVVYIGAPGVTGVDYNLSAAAASEEFDLGALLPEKATVLSVSAESEVAISGTPTVVNVKVGNASAGAQLLADGACHDGSHFLTTAAAGAPVIAPVNSAQNIFVTLTATGGNVDTLTAGTWVIEVNFIK
jgi:hypothetical protein